jgi:CheY-like chemotaxis protein
MCPLTASVRPAEHPLALLAHRRDSLDAYARYLLRESYRVEETDDGRQALVLALSRRPHVVIADADLPGIDGFQLCEVLRRDRLTQATPIIVVSSDTFPADIAQAARVGADVLLTRPCILRDLSNALEFCRVQSWRVRERATAAQHRAEEQLAHSTDVIERARAIRNRTPLSHALNRHATTSPPVPPPVLQCPSCDAWLVYRDSHLGGVNLSRPEQWDYYDCPSKCGTFQHRQRTRNVRKVSSSSF